MWWIVDGYPLCYPFVGLGSLGMDGWEHAAERLDELSQISAGQSWGYEIYLERKNY